MRRLTLALLLVLTGCAHAPLQCNVADYQNLQACIDDVEKRGGGTCVVDDQWTSRGGKTDEILSSKPRANVAILDKRGGRDTVWKVERLYFE